MSEEDAFINAIFDVMPGLDVLALQVYADWLEEKSFPEASLIRKIGDLVMSPNDLNILKEIHKLNHRFLFEPTSDKAFPLSVLFEPYRLRSLLFHSPPYNKNKQQVFYFPEETITTFGKIPAKSWTISNRPPRYISLVSNENNPLGYFGKIVNPQEVGSDIKKAMFYGYLNHFRKKSEKLTHVGPRRKAKELRAVAKDGVIN